MDGICWVEAPVESAEDEVGEEGEAAGVLDAVEVEAELPVEAEDTDEELGVELEFEDAEEREA